MQFLIFVIIQYNSFLFIADHPLPLVEQFMYFLQFQQSPWPIFSNRQVGSTAFVF